MLLQFVACVVVVTVLALGEVRANNLLFAAYQQAQSGLNSDSALSETSFGNYYTSLEQYLELAVHRDGPEPAYISEQANLFQDVARFFNIPTFQDMEFEQFPDLAKDITSRIKSICPDFNVVCDHDLAYRPINNFCNNKMHPRWGNPKIAQLRLAPALWETTHLISLLFDVVGVLLPLDPYGAQLFPAGVLKPLIFHLSGNAGFNLAVLRPKEICIKQECESGTSGQGSCNVDGIIHTITLAEQISKRRCLHHDTYSNVGNQIKVVNGCSAVFEVCYQPLAAVIHIERDEGETSYIELYDEEGRNPDIVAKYNNPKLLYPEYGSGDPGAFWLDFQEGVILVGYGSDCNPGTGILKAEFDIDIIKRHLSENAFRYSLAASVQKSKQKVRRSIVHCDVPTSDVLQLETHISDSFSNIRTLDSFPFLHASASVRFGLRTDLSSSTVKVDLIDTSHELKVTLTLGLQDGDSNIEVFYQGVLDEKLQQTLETPSVTGLFEDGNGASRSGFAPFWLTWLGNRIYTGTGNVLGKNANIHFLDLGFSHYLFTVDHVVLHSNLHADWLFDIVQWGVPRKTSTSGRPLPSARDVSLAVHSNIGGTVTWSPRLTMAVMQMGQFLDHDLIATPTESVHGCEPISCCVDGQPVPLDQQSRFCFNIDVTTKTDSNGNQGSFPSTNTSCLPFTRSATIIECDLLLQDLRNREQMNVLTSFIDASNVYGSEIETARQLRDGLDHTGAFLRSDRGLELPQTTEAGEIPCNNADNPHLLCRKGGDFRAMEQPMLASMHTVWLREHNRLVQGLLDLGSGYSLGSIAEREILYQTARKILIAEMQVVAYDGYLPSFMDSNIMTMFGMKQGDCTYDPKRNPGIRNEWGIANRMGHTWVSGLLHGSSGAQLVTNFFNPTLSYSQGSDPMLKAMADNECPETDKLMEDAVREHLFRVGADANDLAALNVQRGRDHGVSYCRAREAFAKYGVRVPKTFNDLITHNIIPKAAVEQLMKCYDCVCDIDLFTGIVIETPLKDRVDYTSDSTNGELLNFILAEFFGDAKCGDRYWYEFPDSKFSKDQIKALSKSSLSRILCDNQVGTNITEIQADAFRVIDATTNPIRSCESFKKIPKLDLELFPRKPISIEAADSVKSPAKRTEGNAASVTDGGLVNLSDRTAEEGHDEQNDAMHAGRAYGSQELNDEVIAGRTAKGGDIDAVGGDSESELGMTDRTGVERDMTEDMERQRDVEREKKVKELEEIHHLLDVLRRLEDK